jgi:hypothetical protein
MTVSSRFVAVLSTTVLPLDGTYKVRTLQGEEREQALGSLADIPHYCGHPDTKTLLEAMGAKPAPTKLFTGQKVGETVLCVPIKQGLSTRAEQGFTVHQAIAEFGTLDVKVVERLELHSFVLS